MGPVWRSRQRGLSESAGHKGAVPPQGREPVIPIHPHGGGRPSARRANQGLHVRPPSAARSSLGRRSTIAVGSRSERRPDVPNSRWFEPGIGGPEVRAGGRRIAPPAPRRRLADLGEVAGLGPALRHRGRYHVGPRAVLGLLRVVLVLEGFPPRPLVRGRAHASPDLAAARPHQRCSWSSPSSPLHSGRPPARWSPTRPFWSRCTR